MTAYIDIPGLDEALTLTKDDLFITETEQEQTTHKATLPQFQGLDLSQLTPLPFPLASGDVLFGEETNGDKFSTEFFNVTFPSGTKIWIFANRAPPGWIISADTGDRLLAVKGGGTYTTGGVAAGTWQLSGVNGDPGTGLSIEQIPWHLHRGQKSTKLRDFGAGGNSNPAIRGKELEDDSRTNYKYENTLPVGGGQTHNHGNTWRPRAVVGLVIEKI